MCYKNSAPASISIEASFFKNDIIFFQLTFSQKKAL